MPRSSKLLLLPLGLLLAAVLVSCNESKEEEAAEHASNATTTTTTSAQPVQVVALDLGRNVGTDKQVTERIETFKPNDTIYASIHTTGSAPSSTMSVKWMDQNGQVLDQSEQPIVTAEGSNAMEFHLSKPGLAPGTYKVEVFVDGNSVQSKEFHVIS